MNDRLKELMLEAGYATPEMAGRANKLAELIVRECADACLHDDWEDPRWGRFYANKIKQHFGIKE